MLEKCYLDTNVLVYYKLKQSPHHSKAVSLLASLVKKEVQLFISSLIIDEFLNALLRSHRIYKQKIDLRTIQEGLRDVLFLPNIQIINPPSTKEAQLEVIPLMEKFNLRPRDAYHLLTILENNIRFFATFDDDFEKAFKKKIILPIKSFKK